MLKKTITYTDYNGVERTEDFYFNLTQAEVVEMEMGTTGSFSEMLKRIINAKELPTLIAIFKDIVLKAYGQKSIDGKRFIKSKEIANEFEQNPAYSVLFMELATDADAASDFVKGILPAEATKKVDSKKLSND